MLHTQTPLYQTWSGTSRLSFIRVTRRDSVNGVAGDLFEEHSVTLRRRVDTVWLDLEGPIYDTLTATRGEGDTWHGTWICDQTYPFSDSVSVAEQGTWELVGQDTRPEWQ
jgi:hypothetical protein